MFDGGRLVGKIAAHCVKGNEDFARVEAVVTGILFLGLHDADDGIRNGVHPDRLTECFPFGEELLFCVAAEESDVAGFFVVLIVVEAALGGGDAANFLKGRKSADDWNGAAIEEAADLRVVAEFGHDVFASRRFFCDLNVILFQPANHAARTRAASLHAGAATKNNHDVFAKGFLIFLDAVAETFASRDHDGYRDDAPSDTEHSEKRPALLGPERHQSVTKEIAKRHGRFLGYCRTTFCFSFRPETISVLTPLEMPSFTLIFFLPLGPLASGIST